MRIAFFCYPAIDNVWSAKSVETGIGGSEEAVIHMAALLAARGHEVSVYNSHAADPLRIGGVTYESYGPGAESPVTVAVVWRRPGLLSLVRKLQCRRIYLWLHDMLDFERIAPRVKHFHKVMVLSRFHRSRYPQLRSDRLFVTQNGIVPGQFQDIGERDPNLMVYGSSYNRGLRTLLENWRRIRTAVPDARLRIFYGWDVWQHCNPVRCARLRPYFERLMLQEGITHLGRIGHREVAQEYSRAGLWAYPCCFPETSCISAMKAQAGGAVPVVIPTGALTETVRHGFKTMRSYTDFLGLQFPRRIIDEWLDGLVDLLRSPDKQERIRQTMIPDSRRRFAWSGVADAWEQEFASP